MQAQDIGEMSLVLRSESLNPQRWNNTDYFQRYVVDFHLYSELDIIDIMKELSRSLNSYNSDYPYHTYTLHYYRVSDEGYITRGTIALDEVGSFD